MEVKTILGVNDEKVLQLIEYIVLQMVLRADDFSSDMLATVAGRLKFEKVFSDQICKPVFTDVALFMANKAEFQHPIEEYLLELNQP